jgi:hypothetical protein
MMSFSTPSSVGNLCSLTESSASVTSIDGENLSLALEELNYISDSCCSDCDPCLVLHLIEDGVMDALIEAAGYQIPNLPPPPIFLDTSSPE